jgi:hypothetical protein
VAAAAGQAGSLREALAVAVDIEARRLCDPGMLTQGGQGSRPAPLASRLYRIPTHFPLHLHGI